MRQCALAVFLLLAAEVGGEETGLSKGLPDPSHIGTQCGVMAGRTDRARTSCRPFAHDLTPLQSAIRCGC
jgi:hypothetical protein